MFWMRSGVLSDKKIEKFLGKKIYIWPFERSKLKGATYNLTASCFAVNASDKECLVNSQDEIIIPSGETALIQTNESIYVAEDICGTYHSKVTLVSNGLSHIGTTLDPGYFGTSLIAVHNHSSKTQKINVGDTFVSLMFHKMPKSSRIRHDNQPFRSDLINLHDIKYNKNNASNTKKDIKDWYDIPWRNNLGELKDVVHKHVQKRDKAKKNMWVDVFSFSLGLIIISIIIYLTLSSKTFFGPENNNYYQLIVTIISIFIIPGIKYLNNFIKRNLGGE